MMLDDDLTFFVVQQCGAGKEFPAPHAKYRGLFQSKYNAIVARDQQFHEMIHVLAAYPSEHRE